MRIVSQLARIPSHLHASVRRFSDFRVRSETPRRALLYVPGNDVRKVKKVASLRADCVVLDCEDGVGFDKKDEARSTIASLYEEVSKGYGKEVGVRVNSPSSGLAGDDLNVILHMPKLPACLVVPKIDTCDEISWVCNEINEACQKNPAARGLGRKIELIFMTETGRGLLNIKDVIESGMASCSRHRSRCRVSGVIFGSDDFCADLEITRSRDAHELTYARQKIVATAKAFGLQAVDMVYIDYKDSEGLQRQAEEGARMGFTGKQVIHPSQVDVVQRCFTPSSHKIEWARHLIAEFEACEQGVFVFRGQMIDQPTVLQARNIVRLADKFNDT